MTPRPVDRHPYRAMMPAPIYWIFRVLRTLLVALCFACFWGGCVVVGWLWLPFVVLWPGARDVKLKRAHRTMRHGFQFFHFWARVFRMYYPTSSHKVLRPPGVSAASPVVLVANHPTLCDVTSIVARFPNVVAVARPGLANHPLLRRLVRVCGFVPVGTHLLKECEERLRMGFDVLIFPEGTRSPFGHGLQPFHRGAFEVAARAKVPVVLLKLTCTPSALSKGLPIWKMPDRIAVLTIEPIEAIYPADGNLDSRGWARATEQRYNQLLGYSSPTPAVSEQPSAGGAQ